MESMLDTYSPTARYRLGKKVYKEAKKLMEKFKDDLNDYTCQIYWSNAKLGIVVEGIDDAIEDCFDKVQKTFEVWLAYLFSKDCAWDYEIDLINHDEDCN